MARTKKHSKGRLDRYYHLAKESGYRARSAFKLIQLNKKYNFLSTARVLIDLCAAPGGWLQVAEKYMPATHADGSGSIILGVDLDRIKPIPRVRTAVEDITKESCRKWIRGEIKDWKADVVLHDGAPNVGTSWTSDAYQQSLLVLHALSLAVAFLGPGGVFVTKVFRSRDYNSLLWVFHQLFDKVEATKPASSRNVSAEIFVVCRGYKAPAKVDPKLLDPRHVFKELDSDEEGQVKKDAEKQTINSLVHPEHKNRHRTGYATGDYTLRKVGTVREFIESKDPVAVLAGSTELVFGAAEEKEKLKAESRAKVEDSKSEYAGSDEEDEEVKMVEKMVSKRKGIPEDVDLAAKIPEDIQALFADLRVLGKAEFRTLLRWRESFRKKNGMEAAKPAAKEAADDDQELDPMDALSAQLAEQQKNTKLERRKRLEKKKKQLMRLNLGMDAHADIADESGDIGFASWEEEVAALKAEKEKEDEKESEGEEEEEEWDEEKEAEGRLRELEEEMDTMYEVYLEKQLSRDAKAKLRKSKDKEKSAADEPWFGVEDELRRIQEKKEAEGEGSSSDDSDSEDDEHEGSDSDGDEMDVDDDEDAEEVKVEARRETQGDEKLSRRAKLFFENPLFKDVLGSLEEGRKTESRKGDASSTKKRSRIDLSDEETEKPKKAKKRDTKVIGAGDESSDEEFIKNARKNRKELRKKGKAARKEDSDDEKSDSEGGNKQTFEVVPAEPDPELSGDEDDPEILATPQAITAALALARGGRKAKRDIIDASFNRYAFNDQKGALPRWFLDDEGKHNKPQLPISKEAVQVIRARARQLDARPIKKIAEAKGRKKLRALKRIQKLKSEMGKIWEDNDPGTTELQKARAIQKLAEKAAKGKGTNSKKEKPKLVVAKGFAKGVKGRPKGVKGRYKMVDGRMKKELRAQKRIAKAGKAKRRR